MGQSDDLLKYLKTDPRSLRLSGRTDSQPSYHGSPGSQKTASVPTIVVTKASAEDLSALGSSGTRTTTAGRGGVTREKGGTSWTRPITNSGRTTTGDTDQPNPQRRGAGLTKPALHDWGSEEDESERRFVDPEGGHLVDDQDAWLAKQLEACLAVDAGRH